MVVGVSSYARSGAGANYLGNFKVHANLSLPSAGFDIIYISASAK